MQQLDSLKHKWTLNTTWFTNLRVSWWKIVTAWTLLPNRYNLEKGGWWLNSCGQRSLKFYHIIQGFQVSDWIMSIHYTWSQPQGYNEPATPSGISSGVLRVLEHRIAIAKRNLAKSRDAFDFTRFPKASKRIESIEDSIINIIMASSFLQAKKLWVHSLSVGPSSKALSLPL